MAVSVEGYEATLQHIGLLRRKRDALADAQAQAEAQLLHRAAVAYTAGDIGMDDLAAIYADYRALADSGYATRWNAIVPMSSGRVMAYIKVREYREPNPDGTWEGAYPFGQETTPGTGQSVVYVLFDSANVPCYVGSTGHFRKRLHQHEASGKQFTYWRAHPCATRADAYALESRLLREHKPYLNKKAAA